MKNKTGKFVSLLLTISALIYVVFVSTEDNGRLIKDPVVSVNFQKDLAFNQEDLFSPNLGKSFTGFKEALGFKESQNDYFRVNTYGYLGKYQFGKSTLKVIGIYHPKLFLNTPELQEKAFIANTQRNKWVLRKDIKRFSGSYINGIKITESGILAAAHLAGPGSVKKYLRSYGEVGFSDAFGTSISNYMKKFSGYDTSSIAPQKRVKVKYQSA